MADEAESVENQLIEQVLGKGHVGKDDEPPLEPDPPAENAHVEGEDETEDKPEDEAPEGDGFVDVEYEGNLYSVPPELKDALSRTQDYTKKTQELASQRKEFEASRKQIELAQEQQKFMGSIQQEAGQIQTLDFQIQETTKYLKDHFEQMSDKDILKLRMNIDEARAQKDELTNTVRTKFTEFQQAQEQSQKELLAKSTEVLQGKVSNWSKVEGEVIQFARDLGFTESQVRVAQTDPKQMLLVHDAMQYRKLQDGKAAAVKKLAAVPTIKPKTRDPMPADVRRKLDVKNKLKSKSLSSADKAKLIGEDLADRWA